MKKGYIVLIVVGAVIAIAINIFVFLQMPKVLDNLFLPDWSSAEIEIDSYRLCVDEYGEDVVIIRYFIKNNGRETTTLSAEGYFEVYQNGVALSECYEDLPRDCYYDSNDQYRNIKSGAEYYAEIAYYLEYPYEDIEVEVEDYGLFYEKKSKVFTLQ